MRAALAQLPETQDVGTAGGGVALKLDGARVRGLHEVVPETLPQPPSVNSPRSASISTRSRVEHQGGQTLLSGVLADQPALHGILDKVRDLGLSIIAVRRLPPPEEPDVQG